jgi:hypothetical protein
MKYYVSFTILLCLISQIFSNLAASNNVEDIIYRLSTVTFSGVNKTPYEMKTCNIKLLIQFNPVLRVNPVFNILTLDYYDALPYKDDFAKFLDEKEDFEKCELNKIYGFSEQNTRMHLNFNWQWNGGFYISLVNLVDNPTTGDWSLQLKFQNNVEKSKILAVSFDFEKIRSKEDIDILVEYFNSIKK